MFKRKDATWASLAYRYYNPSWDVGRNLQEYGQDFSAEGIGGNMRIWLEVEGELSASGLLLPENALTEPLALVKSLLDHRCLFEIEPWFVSQIPTLENISLFLADHVWKRPPQAGRWSSLTVDENDRWSVRVHAENGGMTLFHRFQKDGLSFEAAITGTPDNESGLIFRRATVLEAVERLQFDNRERAFHDLRAQIPSLASLSAESARRTAWTVTFSP